MKKNDIIPSPEFTNDTKYLLWKQAAEELLSILKNELRHPKETFTLQEIFATIETQDSLHHVFNDGLRIANQKYEYFMGKVHEVGIVTDEYALVELNNKSDDFLKTFRKNITIHINKYTWYLDEFEIYFGEFKKMVTALGEKWSKLSYLASKRKEINILKDCYSTIYRQIQIAVEHLQKLRVAAFHILQGRKSA